MLVLKSEYTADIEKAENLIVNSEGVIIGTNADDIDEGLGEMCILVADGRPVKYLECKTIDNKKVFILSNEEINRIDKELEEDRQLAI